MNKSEEFREDVLRRYINPDKIEKAPEGFTENIITRISSEETSTITKKISIGDYLAPILFGLFTFLLIIAAVFLPASDINSAFFAVIKPLNDIHITLPQIDFDRLSEFTFPKLMIYISVAIVLLALFDMALNTFFHREKK
jgi:hypothetical protein